MISRVVLAALAVGALTGAAPAQDTKQSPLSTDISAQRGGGFRGGGGSLAGGGRSFSGFSGGGMRGFSGGSLSSGGFRGGGFPGGGMRTFSGGGMRTFSGGGFRSLSGVPGGGFRFAGTTFRDGVGPGMRVGPGFRAASLANPGVRAWRSGTWRSGAWHGDRHHGRFRRAAVVAGVGGLWWGADSWYPYGYANGPYCSGYDGNGCLLRWANVPVGGGYYEQRCVSYCGY